MLTGLPNSGKSSLFNALCGEALAIVTDLPGTTRDYLQHRVSALTEFDLIDTAGWELLKDDSPRALAQAQLPQRLADAQLAVLCIDMSTRHSNTDYWSILKELAPEKDWLVVGTKRDLVATEQMDSAQQVLTRAQQVMSSEQVVITSSREPNAMAELTRVISTRLTRQDGRQRGDQVAPLAVVHETAVRCRAALDAARSGLTAALETARSGMGEELIAAELRLVLEDLASIIGEVHSDDVLGEIFSRFCIGK